MKTILKLGGFAAAVLPLGKLFKLGRNVRDDERGNAAIEYSLIAALVGVAAIAAFSTVGANITTTMNKIGNCVLTPAANCMSSGS